VVPEGAKVVNLLQTVNRRMSTFYEPQRRESTAFDG